MRKLKMVGLLFISISLLGHFPSLAQAGTVFVWESTCDFFCGSILLADGDPVSGFIEFNPAAILVDAVIGKADVMSFEFNFGGVGIDDSTAAAFNFSGQLDPTGTEFLGGPDGFAIFTSNALTPSLGDGLFAFALNGDAGSGNTSCGQITCGGYGWAGTAASLGQSTLQAVPIPPAILLLGSGLVGLMFGRRVS
jgi:hypothetical protein